MFSFKGEFFLSVEQAGLLRGKVRQSCEGVELGLSTKPR